MKVAVVGGAGYVGQFVSRSLLEAGHDVVVVAGGNASFLLEGTGLTVVPPVEAERMTPFDALVNLAYPNRGSQLEFPRRNRELVASLRRLARGSQRVVHTSTLAVFGFDLDRPQVRGRVRSSRDFPYVEVKVEMEHLLEEDCGAPALEIVRLGNVWGPGSPNWTAPIADKLLFGDPVGVEDSPGVSNVTDVGNVAAYLSHLVSHGIESGIRFHHLAEFAAVPWRAWIEPLASALGVEPVHAADFPRPPDGWLAELKATTSRLSPISIAGDWRSRRRLGSLYRSLVRLVPRGSHVALRRASAAPAFVNPERMEDADFLRVTSAKVQFQHWIDAGWTAPVTQEAAMASALAWLDEVGY